MSLAAPPAITTDDITLTLSFARADGLERVGFLCTIARAIVAAPGEPDGDVMLSAMLSGWPRGSSASSSRRAKRRSSRYAASASR